MWLLFHRKAGTKVVRDGRSFDERCPTCERVTRFEEIEMSESYGLFFAIDVVGDKERAFRCRACGDVFDLRDREDEPAASERSTRGRPAEGVGQRATTIDRTAELAAEQRRRDAEQSARAIRIEDELAELKKRMGK
jgi:hypothetical protein